MRILTKEVSINTSRRRDLVNVTHIVEGFVEDSGVSSGIILTFLPHATAGFLLNEDEPNLRKDYMALLERLVPENGPYEHNRIDDNADSHLLASIYKQFLIIPIVNGKLARGTWQEVMLLELDGPRSRRMIMVIVGD